MSVIWCRRTRMLPSFNCQSDNPFHDPNPSTASLVFESQGPTTDPRVVAVTLAPTPASTGETTSESSRAGTEIENQCVICPNGPSTGFDDYAPYADDEYDRTCAQLIQNALTVESGTADCGWYEFG